MGLLRKIALGITSILLIAFVVITLVINIQAIKSSNSIVNSTLSVVKENQKKSDELLRRNVTGLIKKLADTDHTITKIVRSLYDTSYQTLVNSTANQIFPMIGNFDFDSANAVVSKLQKSSAAITWIQYSTSATPKSSDIYTFGEKVENNSKIYSRKIKSDFAFLNIKLQVSLQGLQAIANVNKIFQDIDSDNKRLLNQITDLNQKAVIEAGKFAHITARENNRSLLIWIVGTMALILAIILALLAFFTRKWVTDPLYKIAGNLHASSSKVEKGSDEITDASTRLADGSSEQAAALEETSSTLEEISAMTNQNADNTSQAEVFMKEVVGNLSETGKKIAELTSAMAQIAKASDETSKINKIIDDIAFQTNLLALNAAVEAARAGEAGAGFAVVADEVRNLAMRAGEAAKSSEAVIESTAGTVSNGSKITAMVNDSFTKLDELLDKVKSLIFEISGASSEQNNGIKQINSAVASQSQIVQQNSADTDVFANTAKGLSTLTAELYEMVNALMTLLDGRKKTSEAGPHAPSRKGGGQKMIA
ncbi:MAG: hypothetical protein GXP59_08835 [Deltaproteobacteria bacterium]|nr:hypothetical protein [Deltaproteobacteria bacterium]